MPDVMIPWAAQRDLSTEIKLLRAAAAFESHLFENWQSDRRLNCRGNHDEHQQLSMRFLAEGRVRTCYTDFGAAARSRELAAVGADPNPLSFRKWMASYEGDAALDKCDREAFDAELETLSLMRWAFAHEARMARFDGQFTSRLRRMASAQQVERMSAAARGEVGSIDFYPLNGALGELARLDAARRSAVAAAAAR